MNRTVARTWAVRMSERIKSLGHWIIDRGSSSLTINVQIVSFSSSSSPSSAVTFFLAAATCEDEFRERIEDSSGSTLGGVGIFGRTERENFFFLKNNKTEPSNPLLGSQLMERNAQSQPRSRFQLACAFFLCCWLRGNEMEEDHELPGVDLRCSLRFFLFFNHALNNQILMRGLVDPRQDQGAVISK